MPKLPLVVRASVSSENAGCDSFDCIEASGTMPQLLYPVLSLALGKNWGQTTEIRVDVICFEPSLLYCKKWGENTLSIFCSRADIKRENSYSSELTNSRRAESHFLAASEAA